MPQGIRIYFLFLYLRNNTSDSSLSSFTQNFLTQVCFLLGVTGQFDKLKINSFLLLVPCLVLFHPCCSASSFPPKLFCCYSVTLALIELFSLCSSKFSNPTYQMLQPVEVETIRCLKLWHPPPNFSDIGLQYPSSALFCLVSSSDTIININIKITTT